MKITRFVTAQISETVARERIILYLAQAGYNQVPAAAGQMTFKRGAVLASYSIFNPLKWACTLKISLNSEPELTKIYLQAEIVTDPTEKRFGEELLTAELALFETAVTNNEFKYFDAADLKKRVAAQVKRSTGIIGSALLCIITGVIFGRSLNANADIGAFLSWSIGIIISLILAGLFIVLWRKKK